MKVLAGASSVLTSSFAMHSRAQAQSPRLSQAAAVGTAASTLPPSYSSPLDIPSHCAYRHTGTQNSHLVSNYCTSFDICFRSLPLICLINITVRTALIH